MQGEDGYPPGLRHHLHPMHKVPAQRASTQSPLEGPWATRAVPAGCLAAAPTRGCPGGAAAGWGFPEPLCQAGPYLHGGTQPGVPRLGAACPQVQNGTGQPG